MPKVLTISGMSVAVLIFLLFGLDLAVGFPFGGANKMMDSMFVACALMLGYMSWTTLREQT